MDGQSATAARERRGAHARRQVRHAAGHWLSDENVPPANKHRMRQCCVFLLVLVATSSIRRGTTRPRPRGQETVSRSVCLSRAASCNSIFVPLARFARQWARGSVHLPDCSYERRLPRKLSITGIGERVWCVRAA